jgi:hypothetical protein
VVGGDPDILLASDLEAGNILAKQMSFSQTQERWIVLGARIPIVPTIRADKDSQLCGGKTGSSRAGTPSKIGGVLRLRKI